MIYWINIVALAGLASVMLVGASHAANHNPWSLYNRNGGGSAALAPKFSPPLPAWQSPANPVQRLPRQQRTVEPFGSDYVPLPGEQKPLARPGYGFQQPYPVAPRYPYGNGFGGQFGFGMSMSPQGWFGGMPFGSGYPAMPYAAPAMPYGSTPYGGAPYGRAPYGGAPYGGAPYGGVPYGGLPFGNVNPWNMGFPMF